MTERLSDEMLRAVALDHRRARLVDFAEVQGMALELLVLRSVLAAGPVMPEGPSGAVLSAGAELLRDQPAAPTAEIYATFRASLAREQSHEH